MKFDNRFDVVSGADSKGDTVYIDRHIPQFSRKLKDKTGRPANLWKYLGTHEEWEDAAMARGFSYDRAHSKVATPMERKAVEADGVDWKEYTREIDGHLDKIAQGWLRDLSILQRSAGLWFVSHDQPAHAGRLCTELQSASYRLVQCFYEQECKSMKADLTFGAIVLALAFIFFVFFLYLVY